MDSFEKLTISTSETVRQFFRKLQSFFPTTFTKSEPRTESPKILLYGTGVDENMFPSQKNLDVIMDTLRKDLVGILRDSSNNKSVTVILYKLNTLDNNIREACRFQQTWIKHPISGKESLKVQEKYIVRLIEEIMDDIFEAYSSLKRRSHHSTFNERSINGVISVLGILKREVCNMINVVISSIEAHYMANLYSIESKSICGPYLYNLDNKKSESLFSHENSFAFMPENSIKSVQDPSYEKTPTLLISRSYPMFVKKRRPLFSSLQNVSSTSSKTPCQSVNYHQTENIAKEREINIYSKDKHPHIKKTESIPNIEDIANGCGDMEKKSKILRIEPYVSSLHVHYDKKSQSIPNKTIESYFTYEERKISETPCYDGINVHTKINQNLNRERMPYLKTKDNSQEGELYIKKNLGISIGKQAGNINLPVCKPLQNMDKSSETSLKNMGMPKEIPHENIRVHSGNNLGNSRVPIGNYIENTRVPSWNPFGNSRVPTEKPLENTDVSSKKLHNKFNEELQERKSMHSWPIATVVRDIKSDNYLDSYSKIDNSKCSRNSSGQIYENPTDYPSSDSDSDDSYISCALDEYELGADFLNHVKEQYIQKPLEMLIHKTHSIRDKTDNFSCKSAKMSEIFTSQKSSRSSDHKPEMYHSVESVPCLNLYRDEEIASELAEICKEIAYIDSSVSTEQRVSRKIKTSDDFMIAGTVVNEATLDSYNTLALMDEDYFRRDNEKVISPIVSLTSVTSDILNSFEGNSQPANNDYYSLHHRQINATNQKDVGPNLEDSQFSSMCLTKAISSSKVATSYLGDESKLLAIEVQAVSQEAG